MNWSIKLSESNLDYLSRRAIKGQIQMDCWRICPLPKGAVDGIKGNTLACIHRWLLLPQWWRSRCLPHDRIGWRNSLCHKIGIRGDQKWCKVWSTFGRICHDQWVRRKWSWSTQILSVGELVYRKQSINNRSVIPKWAQDVKKHLTIGELPREKMKVRKIRLGQPTIMEATMPHNLPNEFTTITAPWPFS